jgi:hypothetical protein
MWVVCSPLTPDLAFATRMAVVICNILDHQRNSDRIILKVKNIGEGEVM